MAVLTLAIGSTDAAGRDIMEDWVISDGITRVSNETVDVRGNVLIMDGGHLWLENSTLIINGSQDGEFGLVVNRTSVGGDILELGKKLYSTTPVIQIHIAADSPTVIVHENGTVRSLDEEHRWRYELEEGRNVVRFDVEDRAGNSGGTFVDELFLDTTEPFIVIYEPPLDPTTKKGGILVHGVTEEGSVAKVDGNTVDVTSGGEFRRFVDLEEGPNEIIVEITDVVGNTNATVCSVKRTVDVEDEEAPASLWIAMAIIVALIVLLSLGYRSIGRRRKGVKDRSDEDKGSPARPPGPRSGTSPSPEEETSPSDWVEYQ